MSEKPGKRLVGWKQYLLNLTKKTGNHTMSGILLASSVLFGVAALAALFCGLGLVGYPSGTDEVGCMGISFLLGLVAVSCFLHSADQGRKGKAIQVGEPITRHNVHRLPAVETLVRPSYLPASHQQTELLRAAEQGQETPAEELLRASVTEGTGHRDGQG